MSIAALESHLSGLNGAMVSDFESQQIYDAIGSLGRKSRREGNGWKLSVSFVNLNGFKSSSPSEDMAEAKWLSLATSMPT